MFKYLGKERKYITFLIAIVIILALAALFAGISHTKILYMVIAELWIIFIMAVIINCVNRRKKLKQ